jgi:basic membrane protein A
VNFGKLVTATALLALASLCLPGEGAQQAPTGELQAMRVGLVFDVGGRGDKSFNDAAYAGVSRGRDELGVTLELLEPSGAEDREAALRLFAARGFDLVIGVGFIFSTDINVVATDFPKTKFACVDYAPAPGGTIPANVVGLGFREEEGSFLVGAVALKKKKTKHLGFVGGMDIPLIHRFEAGYRAGIQHVCASCKLHVAYAGTTPEAFRDPAKGKAIAISQIAAGADLIYHASGTTGHGVFEAARDMGVKAIGVDSDQHDEMPGTVVTSMIKRVDIAVFDTILSVGRGQFESGVRSFGVADEGVGYVSEGPHAALVPSEVKSQVATLRAAIARGEITVPRK